MPSGDRHNLKIEVEEGKNFNIDYLKFVRSAERLSPVTLISPSGNNQEFNSLPQLTWEDNLDNMGSRFVTSYVIEISTSSDFETPLRSYTSTESTIILNEVLAVGTYFWRVRAIDQNSHASAWSKVKSFIFTE